MTGIKICLSCRWARINAWGKLVCGASDTQTEGALCINADSAVFSGRDNERVTDGKKMALRGHSERLAGS